MLFSLIYILPAFCLLVYYTVLKCWWIVVYSQVMIMSNACQTPLLPGEARCVYCSPLGSVETWPWEQQLVYSGLCRQRSCTCHSGGWAQANLFPASRACRVSHGTVTQEPFLRGPGDPSWGIFKLEQCHPKQSPVGRYALWWPRRVREPLESADCTGRL